MTVTFTSVLNLSISASWLILAVLPARLVLRKAPKALHCALWGLVALRLLCPVSIESSLSLQPTREVIPRDYLLMEPSDTGFSQGTTLDIVTNPVYDTPVSIEIEPTVDRVQHLDVIASLLWLTGMGVMAIYAAYSYLSLRLRLRVAAWVEKGVYECDSVDSPFILGLLRPRIYLPSGLEEQTKRHVLAHERAHLSRLDHLWKPLGFFLLSVHWFNPLMWLSYWLLCRDIELACDEKVVKKLDRQAVVEYSNALIRCAVPHRTIALCPLAFGEGNVKGRIRSILSYKKPGFWVILTAVILSIVLAVGFLTDPAVEEVPVNTRPHTGQPIDAVLNEEGFTVTETLEQELEFMFYIHWLPEECFTPAGYGFAEGELTLYESDTTFLDLVQVIPEGEQLRFDVRFRYNVPESGTVLLPCHINIKGVDFRMRLSGTLYDYSRDYPSGVILEHSGDTMEYSFLIDRELVENADDYLMIGLSGLYETTYVPTGLNLTGFAYHVDKSLFRDEQYTLTGSAAYAPTYIIGRDMHLTALESCTRWEIRRDMGELTPMELTEANFDYRFRGSYDPEELRKKAARAWYCQEQELSHILIQDTDGSLYLAVLREEENLICDLYRLEQGESTDRAPEVITRSFAFSDPDAFDTPTFTLASDGTFHMRLSMVSSYFGYGRYILEEDSLVLKTDDGLYTWFFIPDGRGFRYDAARSSPVDYMKTARELAPLPDGAYFGTNTIDPISDGDAPGTDTTEDWSPPLEVYLNETILEHNYREEDAGLIRVENHEVLGELIACGVSTADGGAPLEILTVYVAGEYRTYRENLVSDRFEIFCAAITLESTGSGYTVTDYWQATPKESETIFPEHIQELFDQRRDIIRSNYTSENLFDARLRLYRDQGVETDIDALLSIICSSPLQSSNPGDYIAAHQAEFDRLVSMGTHTLRHCFAKFAEGSQIGLEGHIMALACREIIPNRTGSHTIPDNLCMTGQDWFDQFAALARQHRDEMGLLEFEAQHPCCFLALQALGT